MGEKQGKYKVTLVYTDLKPGSLWVEFLVTNVSNQPVQLPTKMVIGVISAANVVPALIAPKTMLEKGLESIPKSNHWVLEDRK